MKLREHETIKHVLEGMMIVDEAVHEIPIGMLMEQYRYHGYESEQDVIDDGGKPRRIKVRIIITHEVL